MQTIKLLIRAIFIGVFAYSSVSMAATQEEVKEFQSTYLEYENLFNQQRYEQSLPLAGKALEMGEKLLDTESPEVASLTYNYGLNLLKAGKYQEADDTLALALERSRRVYGEDAVETIVVLMDLGEALGSLRDDRFNIGKTATNLRKHQTIKNYSGYFNEAMRLARQHYGSNSPELGKLSLRAGSIIFDRTRYPADANKYLNEAYRVLKEHRESHGLDFAFSAFYLAKYKFAEGKHSIALGLLDEAQAIYEDAQTDQSAMLNAVMGLMLNANKKLGKSSEAERVFAEILDINIKQRDVNPSPIYKITPEFPRRLRDGEEVIVELEFSINPDGRVADIAVINSENRPAFENAAIAALEESLYIPRIVDGKPVKTPSQTTKYGFRP